jgi:hypothetical protein
MANGTQTVSAVITADAKPFKRSVQDAGKSFDGFSKAAKNFGAVAAVAFAAASAAAVTFLTDSVKAAAESRAIAKGLENAAENAGVFASQAGGITGATDALKDYAQQLGETIGVDDEKILGIVSQWLAVPQLAQLGVGGLKNLVKVAADVAAGTNKDLDSIATAFVRVAGDGETALSKLLRAGIVFTDEQKNVYQSLLDSNDELGAQQYLIDELGKKYEGAAEAIANPFDRISEVFKNFQEEVGEQFLPQIDSIVDGLKAFLDELKDDPEFVGFISDLVKEFKDLAPQIKELVPKLLDFARIAIPAAIAILPGLIDILALFNDTVATDNEGLKDFKKNLEFMFTPLQILITVLGVLIGVVKEVWARLGDGRILLEVILGPIFSIRSAFDIVRDSIIQAQNAWNDFFNIQQDRPLSQVGGADYLERVLAPPPTYADDRRFGASTVNISVNAIAPSAEVGRAVVDSLRNYQRAGGVI